jgi:hypothetical protein
MILDTISTESNLNICVNYSPGFYKLIYKVIDNKTGIFYNKDIDLNITYPFQQGFLILGSTQDSISLGMVNQNDDLFIDVLKKKIGRRLGKNPVSIYHQYPWEPMDKILGKNMWINLIYDNGKCYSFDAIGFDRRGDENDLFLITPSEIKIEGFPIGLRTKDFLINNGHLHHRSFDVKYALTVSEDQFSTKHFCKKSIPLFFERNQKKLMTFHNFPDRIVDVVCEDPTIFDPTNINMDLIFACKGVMTSENYNANCCGVFKDNNTLNILRFAAEKTKGKKPQVYIEPISMHEVESNKNIYNASDMCSTSKSPNLILFSVGSKLYSYNIFTNEETELIDLGSTYEITKLMDKEVYNTNYFSESLDYKVVIGFKNSETGKSGISIYNILLEGGFDIEFESKHENITDDIIDICYKYNQKN